MTIRGFLPLYKAVEIVTENGFSTQHSNFFRRGIETLSRPYKKLYKEKQKQTKQRSLLDFLRYRKKNKTLFASSKYETLYFFKLCSKYIKMNKMCTFIPVLSLNIIAVLHICFHTRTAEFH
jgi:hypothetical protein